MYGDMGRGCGPILVVLIILALVGLAALTYGGWELFQNINISWEDSDHD